MTIKTKGKMSTPSEQDLLEQLKTIREAKKLKEEEEAQQAIDAAFERCFGQTYVRSVNDLKDCFTYRKIKNVRRKPGTQNEILADILEEVFICARPSVDDEWGISGAGYNASSHIRPYKEDRKQLQITEGFIQKGDYPITEKEYNDARRFIGTISFFFESFANKGRKTLKRNLKHENATV